MNTIRFILAVLLVNSIGLDCRAAEPQATPHPVPWEFASDRYAVTVNGKPVTVVLQHFHRHFTAEQAVGCPINHSHAASGEFAPQQVTIS